MKSHLTIWGGIISAILFALSMPQSGYTQIYGGMAKTHKDIQLTKVSELQTDAVAQQGRYTTYSYTFADLIIFSYFDDTEYDVLNASGGIVAAGRLSANSFRVVTPGAGTYGVRSTKPFSLLIGDPISRSVLGYFAADERGKGVSTKLLTYMPKDEYGPERFVVFAYKDGTQIQIKNLSTKTVVWSGILNAGGHYITSGLESTFLEITASEGISALSYTDQGYLVPAENGDWLGRRFYGYAGFVGAWSEDLNIISYENGAQISVRNLRTGSSLWSGTLNKGEIKSLTITGSSAPEVFFDVQASGRVSVSVSPYTAFTQNYFHLNGCVDESGTMIGTLFYTPAINGQLDFSSFEDNNAVSIRRLDTGAKVWSGILKAGQSVSVTTVRSVYEITGTGKLAGVVSYGGSFGGEFRPVFYGADLPDLSITSSAITVDPEFAEVGVPITLRAVINNLGTQTASLVRVSFYDGDPLQNGKLIGQPYQISQIAPSAQATASINWSVPENPGHHRIFVVADEQNSIDESNESNNKAERSFYPNNELEPPLALTIDAPQGLNLDANGNYLPNPFAIRATISNNGSSTCSNISATLELPNGLVLASGQATINLSSLASGQSTTVTWSVRATGTPFGDLIYRILLNSNNCGTKEGKRLIRVPEAPFAADITATWNNQRTGDVDIYVDRGAGFPAAPEGRISSPNTPLRVTGLSVGNKLRAVKKVHVKNAVKGGHEAVDDIMFELWADSDVMAENGTYSPFSIDTRASSFELKMGHAIHKYNLVVSIEWGDTKNDEYYNQLVTGFKKASRYLYDASDGQAMLNKIAIYDNKNHWVDADMQILATQHPQATVDGIDQAMTEFLPGGKIYFGRTWTRYGSTETGGTPDTEDYFTTIIHEFGHYAFGLYDEYLDGTGDKTAWGKYRAAHENEAPGNYGVMDHQYDVTEFSSANDYLKSYPDNVEKEKVTRHYYVRKAPTWDWIKTKLQGYFPDVPITLPPPGNFTEGPRIDREGPLDATIESQTQVLDFRTKNIMAARTTTQISESEVHLQYDGKPLSGALVQVIDKTTRMLLGKTDPEGRVYWPGFQNGTTLQIYRLLPKGLLRATVQIQEPASTYKITLASAEKTGQLGVKTLLQNNGFVFVPTFTLSGTELRLNLLLHTDGALSGNPKIKLFYGNTSDSTTLSLSGTNRYVGQLNINTQTPDFDGSGTFEVRATNSSQELNTFSSSFRMFHLNHNEFDQAFEGQMDIHFSKNNVINDQFGIVSETYSQPYIQADVTLYPVSAMYNVSLELESNLNGGAAINIHYSDSDVDGLDETSLAIYRWNEATKSWIAVAESHGDIDRNVVSARTNQTGTYVIFARAASGDVIPPDRIKDLGASTGQGQGEINLKWTATGDDGLTGTATSYVIRYNEVPISHLNWENSTTIANPPQPVSSGSTQTVTARAPLSNKLYYFAIKVRDEAGNQSELSNNASAISGTGVIPPDTTTTPCETTTFTDDFNDGDANGWKPDTPSQWIVANVEGDPAYVLNVPDASSDEFSVLQSHRVNDFTLTLSAKATAADNKNFFVLFGVNDLNNPKRDAYYLQFGVLGVRLYRIVANSGSEIASHPLDFASDNSFHTITIRRSGDNITAHGDGVLIIDVSDAAFTFGYVGFGSFRSTACFDDVNLTYSSGGATFSDNFDGGNASGWTPLTPSRWQVRNDAGSLRYYLNTSDYNSPDEKRLGELSIINSQTWGDFTFECDAKSEDAGIGNSGADLSLVFGYQDFDSYYYVNYNRESGFTEMHRIHDGGPRVTLATYNAPTFDDGNYHKLRIEREGSVMRAYFDGILILSGNDSFFGEGRIGVGSFNDAGYFDNIVITGCKTSGLPNLLGTALLFSQTTYKPGDAITFSGTVMNNGSSPTRPDFRINVFLTDSPTEPDYNLLVHSFTMPALDAGNSNSFTQIGTIPPTTPADTYYLWMNIDVDDQNPESNEDDNSFRTSTQLTVTRPDSLGGIKPIVSNPQTSCAEYFVDIRVENVTNLFGASFVLNYTNTAYINYLTSENGGFLGNDVLLYANPEDPLGKVSIGVTRKTGQPGSTGSGVIVRVKFSSPASTPVGTPVTFSITDIVGIDPLNNSITLTPQSASTVLNCGTVWPGDTNNDGIVNQADVLPLGLHWNRTGPARTGGSCAWSAQIAAPWTPLAATYADANGDGIVNQADVLCIGLNWNRTHTTASSAPLTLADNTLAKAAFAEVFAEAIPAQLTPGQEFIVRIQVAEARNLFGLAFELQNDRPELLQILSVEPEALFGHEALLYSHLEESGNSGIGITRKNGQSGAQGAGAVIRLKGKISSEARLGEVITLTLNDIVAQNHEGHVGALSPSSLQVVVGAGANLALLRNSRTVTEYQLYQNYPNPFNPETMIAYDILEAGHVTLQIFNTVGQEVRTLIDETQSPGAYQVRWDGRNTFGQTLPSGIYFYRLQAGEFVQIRKMTLVQ